MAKRKTAKPAPASSAGNIRCAGDRVPIGSLTPDPRNARRHDERNVQSVMDSYRMSGQRKPIVVADGVVIAGNCQLEAATRLGWPEIAVTDASDMSETQRRAYAIADNRTAELAEWDDEELTRQLKALADEDYDLTMVGFSDRELVSFLSRGGGGGGEDAPAAPATPFSRTGDLWTLGRHRLLCGDSTKREEVDRVLGGAKPRLMITDPPYGVEYDADWRNDAEQAGRGAGAPGGMAIGKVSNDDRVDWSDAWELSPSAVFYCWHACWHASSVQNSIERAGFVLRAQIVWAKSHLAISRGHYHWQHEPCWYAVRKGATADWIGDRSQSTLWQIANREPEGHTDHSTQKPVECMALPMRNHAGDVYDPFLGSGTTLIAAERLGRTCYGIEIESRYCDVILRRWANETGETPTRDDGTLFPAEERDAPAAAPS